MESRFISTHIKTSYLYNVIYTQQHSPSCKPEISIDLSMFRLQLTKHLVTNTLSMVLTSIISTNLVGLYIHCETIYARDLVCISCVN